MNGLRDLRALLTSMAPEARPDEYVFCSFAGARYGQHADLEPIASVREAEGLSLIVLRQRADERGLPYEGVFRCVTLRVHSSLEAVGLTAAVAAALAKRHIAANIVAGYFHDHVFVPSERLEEAMQALDALAREPDAAAR